MEQNRPTSALTNRITVIDALRGFALLGVILMHMSQHYSIFSFSGLEPREELFPQLNSTIQWISQNIIMGKFINIFAFLFGLSFFIQMDQASKKGLNFSMRFLWRMVILFIIGLIGSCFYSGDILSIYALFGVLLVFLFRFKNWVLMAIFSLFLLGVPRILITKYPKPAKTEQVKSENNLPRSHSPAFNRDKPSFLNAAKANLTVGMERKLAYQFGIYGRGYITFALFILGLVVGRIRFFEKVHLHKKKNLLLFGGFVIAALIINYIILSLPEAPSTRKLFSGLEATDITFTLFASMALKDIYSVLFSGALVLGFIVLYQIKSVEKHLRVMTAYGRMGLTNYEMQSVVGAIIFSIWGLGSIFGNCGATEVFILGLIIYAGQMIVSKYWLKYFLYGPLEWLWRSATYLKLQPLRKKV